MRTLFGFKISILTNIFAGSKDFHDLASRELPLQAAHIFHVITIR